MTTVSCAGLFRERFAMQTVSIQWYLKCQLLHCRGARCTCTVNQHVRSLTVCAAHIFNALEYTINYFISGILGQVGSVQSGFMGQVGNVQSVLQGGGTNLFGAASSLWGRGAQRK
jgi:hypothetical protein